MAKKVKSVDVSKRKRPARSRRWLGHAVVCALFAGVCGGGIYVARAFVERETAASKSPPTVEIVDAPAWMSDALRERLSAAAAPAAGHGVLDGDVVREVADSLRAEPWIRSLKQVRRVYRDGPGDVIRVEAEFRAPVALVQDGPDFWMVDAEGVKLPERFDKAELSRAAAGRGLQAQQFRVITGVRAAAPAAGARWPGQDVAAGIELARLFAGKPYLNDVAMIDVSGVDAQSPGAVGLKNEVVLWTRFGTQVRWGEPVARGPFSVDVPVGQKLATLEKIYEQYRRVDAGRPWIEIRYDRVLYPSDDAQAASR